MKIYEIPHETLLCKRHPDGCGVSFQNCPRIREASAVRHYARSNSIHAGLPLISPKADVGKAIQTVRSFYVTTSDCLETKEGDAFAHCSRKPPKGVHKQCTATRTYPGTRGWENTYITESWNFSRQSFTVVYLLRAIFHLQAFLRPQNNPIFHPCKGKPCPDITLQSRYEILHLGYRSFLRCIIHCSAKSSNHW